MIIRFATAYELNVIKSYAKKVQEESTVGYIKESDPVPSKDGFYSENSYYFVLIDNKKLCGWVLIGESFDPLKGKPIGLILELYVLQNYRKKGFGKKLMKHALAHLKHKGFQTVQLNVYQGNPAHVLYKNLGFNDISTVMEKKL